MPRTRTSSLREPQPGSDSLVRTVQIARAIETFVLIWTDTEPEEWAYRIVRIPLYFRSVRVTPMAGSPRRVWLI